MNGVSDYSCMYTVMNEYEEIKMQVLAPTKSLKHVIPSFNNMMESYAKYGFELPQLFYTDNVVGDRSILEEVMPSLTENVKHVNPSQTEERIQTNNVFAALPHLELPDNVQVFVHDDEKEINDCCQKILMDAANCSRSSSLRVGFDCEWIYRKSSIPIEERSLTLYRDVALVQIAHKSSVYLFRVH